MIHDREALRDWLRAVLRARSWNGSDLAKRIGKSPSTINRFLNDPDATHSLSSSTIRAIEEVTGQPAGASLEPVARPIAFHEPEASPYSVESADPFIANIIEALASERAIDPWILKSNALVGLGFLPGDVLITSLNEPPRKGDVVCAQVYDWSKGDAITVFRLYEPPFLVAVSPEIGFMKPLVVDSDRVMIRGVVLRMVRGRMSGAASHVGLPAEA